MTFQNQLNHAFQQFESGNLEESNQLFMDLFQEKISIKQEVNIRFLYGYLLLAKNQLEQALDNYKQVLNLAKRLEDKELIAQSHHQIGMVHRIAKEYDQAVLQFHKERTYVDQYFSENALFLAANSYEMGVTHLLLGQFERARDYLKQSMTHALKSEDDVMIACAYRGWGDYYKEKRSFDEAESMYNKSIQYFKRADDTLGVQGVEERLRDSKSFDP